MRLYNRCNLNVYDLSNPKRDIKKMEKWDDMDECLESLLKMEGDLIWDGDATLEGDGVSGDRVVERIEFVEVKEKKSRECKG